MFSATRLSRDDVRGDTQEHGSRPGDHPGKHVTSRGDGKGPSCDAGALSAGVRSSKGAAEARAV